MRRKDEDKERRIKEAVIGLILEQGFEGASMSKIAKAAGVSPSTVYVYFENKDQMLYSIYREYSINVYQYLIGQVNCGMEGDELVSALMHGYYRYIRNNYEIFRFIEQCEHCPTLCGSVKEHDVCCTYSVFDRMREKGVFRDCSPESLTTVMFTPVKAIAQMYPEEAAKQMLDEVIKLIQSAVLV